MTLRDRMRTFFSTPANPAPPEGRAWDPSIVPSNTQEWATTWQWGTSGERMHGGDYALRLASVHACVRLLADSVSSLPVGVYRKADGASVAVSPMPSLIRQFHPDLTNVEWLFQVVSSMALRGNAYLLVESFDFLEYPTSLRPIHPDDVTIEPYNDQSGRDYKYLVRGEEIDPSNLVHIRRFSMPGSVYGLSPIQAHATTLGIALAAEHYGAAYFRDAANPSSILSTSQDLTPDQVKRVQREWLNTHGGRRLPAVMTGGFDWKPINISPSESQFLETRSFQKSEIAMIFGIPPHMIGDVDRSTSWGKGIEQQSIGFVTYTLRPWLTIIEAALSRILPRGQFVKFNANALLRGDALSRFTGYTQARNAGWMNVDEIRALEDMPALPNGLGQDYLQPLNMGPLGSDPLAAKAGASDGGDNAPQ